MLLGENKQGSWKRWYELAIPEAERLSDVYIEEFRNEGLLDNIDENGR